LRNSLGRGIHDREMTSGDLATARTFSGGRDGTIEDKKGKKKKKTLNWEFNRSVLSGS